MRDEEKTAEPVVVVTGGDPDAANLWWIWWRKVEEWATLLEAWVRFFSFLFFFFSLGALFGFVSWEKGFDDGG